MLTKTVWISYDLGIGGDYEGLYAWLDNNNAIECGDSLACVRIDIDHDDDKLLYKRVISEIEENIRIDKKTRFYMIRKVVIDGKSKVVGQFLFGKRKGNPWDGFGNNGDVNNDDGE